MRPNDRPAIVTVAVPMASDGSQASTDVALREAEAIAVQAGGIPHNRRVGYSHTVLHGDNGDEELEAITARPELQPPDTSWLILTAEVHA